VPQNFRVWESPTVSDEMLGKATPASNADRVSLHNYSVLSRYMHAHRWLWNIQHWPTMHLSVDAAGRVLSVLTSLRLQEGFHFACTSNGIVTMALEIRMQVIINISRTSKRVFELSDLLMFCVVLNHQ
jgi:hypothetical protein